MKIAVLGAGAVGSTIGKLWHAAGHDVTFAARHATRPRALAAELGERAHAASVAGAAAGAEVVLVAVPALAVTGALQAAGPLDGRIVIDGANSLERGVFGQQQLSLRWTYPLTHDEATALVARIKSGDTAAADPLTAPFEKFRNCAPDDPAFFLGHLSRAVFEAGIWRAVDAKWDGIREAFHGFDPARVAAMTPAEIAATENDPRVIRNKAKIQATVENAREVLAVLDSYGSIRAYFASFPDAHA